MLLASNHMFPTGSIEVVFERLAQAESTYSFPTYHFLINLDLARQISNFAARLLKTPELKYTASLPVRLPMAQDLQLIWGQMRKVAALPRWNL